MEGYIASFSEYPEPLKGKAPLQSVRVGSPMQLCAVDLVGPLPESMDEKSYILVVADYFIR